jgi:hypothetical protein
MFRSRFVRSAAVALFVYGVLGLLIAVAILVVGISLFTQASAAQKSLEAQRLSLLQSLRTASTTLRDTTSATANLQQSLDGARGAADQASALANTSAGTFRALGASLAAINVLGIQPIAGLAPQFATSADQLGQLATSLGATRDSLALNSTDVQRIGTDLNQLQIQLDAVATSLDQLSVGAQSLLPFQVVFYGVCLLLILQSGMSIAAGVALYRLQRALGEEALFPNVRTATTTDEVDRDRVRTS